MQSITSKVLITYQSIRRKSCKLFGNEYVTFELRVKTSLKKWLTFSSYYSTKKFSHFHCQHVLITNDAGFFLSHTIVLRITRSQFCVSVVSESAKRF